MRDSATRAGGLPGAPAQGDSARPAGHQHGALGPPRQRQRGRARRPPPPSCPGTGTSEAITTTKGIVNCGFALPNLSCKVDGREDRPEKKAQKYIDFEDDDVYGQSVEDDYCISPSTAAQFIYSRRDKPATFAEPLEEEYGYEGTDDTADYFTSNHQLTEVDREDVHEHSFSGDSSARLNSCLDQMREVLAESVPEQTMVQAVLDSKFDVQKALDHVLSQGSKQNVKTKNEDALIVGKTTKGHVDAGKSTLMGHLLYLLGNVNKRTMHKYEQESKKAGKASFAYAWVLDETGEERERGVTMDVGMTKFETKTKVITLMDAPGHKDFIPNMITGAAQADVAILVVDASRGEFEAGFETGGQTREHGLLVRSLGVTQLAVAVNKMDQVNWQQERFQEITSKLGQFLKQAGFKESDVAYIPTSGLGGENLVTRGQSSNLTQWYKGKCLLEQIDSFKPPQRSIDKPFRLCVADVFKDQGSGFCVTGKIEAGYIQVGERLLAMPPNETCTAKGITLHDEPVDWAAAGDHVSLTLTGMDIIKINVGCVFCDPKEPIKVCTRFRARVLIFSIEVPITKGFPVLLHYQTISEPATIRRLLSVLHKSTGEVTKQKPKFLSKGQNALIELQTQRPVALELYKDFKELGRFMLRYSGSTIAAGVVTEIKE
ncbi:HBS1-like protein isoform X11 [Calonectris borealis]|uniref:HBS1-like protein isoform X11 n=1 Tax=Calonectris borealis TaxID=1323832 RepID=UPI003F4B22A7